MIFHFTFFNNIIIFTNIEMVLKVSSSDSIVISDGIADFNLITILKESRYWNFSFNCVNGYQRSVISFLISVRTKTPNFYLHCHCEALFAEAISCGQGDCFVVRASLLAMTSEFQSFRLSTN
jgi:hypothetical protein